MHLPSGPFAVVATAAAVGSLPALKYYVDALYPAKSACRMESTTYMQPHEEEAIRYVNMDPVSSAVAMGSVECLEYMLSRLLEMVDTDYDEHYCSRFFLLKRLDTAVCIAVKFGQTETLRALTISARSGAGFLLIWVLTRFSQNTLAVMA
ncbi:hypothetical protein TUN199_09010 [Pyrenophora tritici-repentis]|uniref:Uncharacterized protein n=1 Tax=Pyrenophora tritici-repentis TaxID=45151 RepID=A0A834RYF2_9PLEO|nr:hypothetical protein PtrM4_095450 [Pyrenophora tritici-repentis]KAI0576052.1 hypothetical protein Alg130_08979 [Pyrenophora tritici-repentis]KAI0577989.1 hypothetical protein Alg215_06614 [Pyrenophora tritici-repentis]KAI0607835.1 hypothetical protein TUN205_07925 [Pyrenophora tritici-repentis]KAI0619001.1 hypothetical protein TUN199_09010 [Pyrenophora tritici-repentis]